MYLLSYFTTEDEACYLADSDDGYRWTSRGAPVHRSGIGTGRIRDPFLLRDAGGLYHLLWTDGWESRSIGYAASRDLIVWEDERLLPVMEHLPQTQNAWAPEVYRDEDARMYRIVWSSTVGPGPRDHRIWSSATKDFRTFTESSIFYDPGYNVIDACIQNIGKEYAMLFKDERGRNEPGTEYKAIRLARFAKGSGPCPSVTTVSGLLTPPLTEGPTLYRTNREWVLLVDSFTDGRYMAYGSEDLSSWTELGSRIELPPGMRHGSVLSPE